MPEGPDTGPAMAPDTGLTYLTTKGIRKTARTINPLHMASAARHTAPEVMADLSMAVTVVTVARTVGGKP